jgi:hypothetical protein
LLNNRKAVFGFIFVILLIGIALFSKRKEVDPSLVSTPALETSELSATLAVAPMHTPFAVPASVLTPTDQKKLSALKEILESKNDNDPRMDTELANLSPELKKAMVSYYQQMPSEKRNDRGTVVFLISRKITSTEDVEFLKNVLMEEPCLSLSDCSKSAPPATGEAAHLQGISETTANYPQLMAIKQMSAQYKTLSANSDQGSLAPKILDALNEASHSPNPKIANDAEQAVKNLSGVK